MPASIVALIGAGWEFFPHNEQCNYVSVSYVEIFKKSFNARFSRSVCVWWLRLIEDIVLFE